MAPPQELPDQRLWEIATMPVQPWSELMVTWLAPFRSCLTGPTFRHAPVLVTGALLTPGTTHRHGRAHRGRPPAGANLHQLPSRAQSQPLVQPRSCPLSTHIA